MIYSEQNGATEAEHDIAISVMRGHGVKVINNTIFYSSADAYNYSIEYRYDTTVDTEIRNNLTNKPLWDRGTSPGAVSLSNNNLGALAGWFLDPLIGDLHLANCNESSVIDQGLTISDIAYDLDGEVRTGAFDIGADECSE